MLSHRVHLFDLRVQLLAMCLSVPSLACQAYTTFGTCWGSKWDNPVWANSATVTWGYIEPGEGLGPQAPSDWSGLNTLGSEGTGDIRAQIDAVHGTGAFDAAVVRAFDTWSAAANITFVQVADSTGDFATVTAPDIRIGAYSFAPGDPAGAAGFGPPGDDMNFPDALSGDIAFNNLNNFNIDPGNEGDDLQTGPGGLYLNDIEGLMLHEIGHTLGLGHSDQNSGVMCGYIFPGTVFDGSTCIRTRVNRQLTQDDFNGIRIIYNQTPPRDGDLSLDQDVDSIDVLLATQAALGILPLTTEQFCHGDVGPLFNGTPAPDNRFDAGDVLLILRKSLQQLDF